MTWLSNFRRQSAIKKFARSLGPSLKKRYGVSATYSAGQIRTTVEQARLNMEYIRYAYAMYLEKEAFDSLQDELGNECNYGALKQEVADLCFNGDTDFSTADLISYPSPVGRVICGHGTIESEADSSSH